MQSFWLILIISLPTRNATGRMRVWRALKALGCGVLRDGVYLLPVSEESRQALQTQAEEVVAGGGTAYLFAFDSESEEQQRALELLFTRSDEYAKLLEAIQRISDQPLTSEEPGKLQRQVNRLRREFESIAAIDYFPDRAREQAAASVSALEQSVAEFLSPDEPQTENRKITQLATDDFQGRVWATRRRPWIDRLASAWLIGRFIDPSARFIWLITPADCPSEAVGYDYDGATFTHVGAKVTFETLLASFGLTRDLALSRMGALVHYLDAGGIPIAEATGLEMIMRGLRQSVSDDDLLLQEAKKVFDSLYCAFSSEDT